MQHACIQRVPQQLMPVRALNLARGSGLAAAMRDGGPCCTSLSRRGLLLAATAPLAVLPATQSIAAASPTSYMPHTGRIVAVGDIHGDLAAFEEVLVLSGLYDRSAGEWCGGSSVLVQVGDVLDRGPQELECLRLLRTLKRQSVLQGGAVISLLGNHEVMNAAGLTYMASAASASAFADRSRAFLPGGDLASELASWPVACVVGDTAFCHGALTLAQVSDGLDVGNAEAADWLLGRSGTLPPPMLFPRSRTSTPSPLWSRQVRPRPCTTPLLHRCAAAPLRCSTAVPPPRRRAAAGLESSCDGGPQRPWPSLARRQLSDPSDAEPTGTACAELRECLRMLGAKRLVVGHTVQSAINCACGGAVYRIDVGLSSAMGGAPPQVLEIDDGRVRVLTASADGGRARVLTASASEGGARGECCEREAGGEGGCGGMFGRLAHGECAG